MVGVAAHGADVQDRVGAPEVLRSIRARWPWLRHVFADGGYAGPNLKAAMRPFGDWTIEIIKRSDTANPAAAGAGERFRGGKWRIGWIRTTRAC